MAQTTSPANSPATPGTPSSGRLSRRPKSADPVLGGSAPSPPKRRRPALTALALLLIVGGAALAGLLALRMDTREPVVVAVEEIPVGTKITTDQLATTDVAADGLTMFTPAQINQLLDDKAVYARQTIHPGQLLHKDILVTSPPIGSDQAQVGVPLSAGMYPPGLRSGDAVRLLRRGDGASESRALATGLVLRVNKESGGGAFGGGSGGSVATILVPQSIADQIVGATGEDALGIALLGRGVSIDDATVETLSGSGDGR